MKRVLVACEHSGIVRDAFLTRGFDAWSCDLQPCERHSNRHIRGDVRKVLKDGWDLLIVAHPPCTRLCNSGLRWLTTPPPGRKLDEMWAELKAGAELFSDCWNAPVPFVAVENPIMHRHAKALIQGYEPPAQFAQPWWFGDPYFKRLGLFLRGLPALVPTNKLVPPNYGTAEHRAWSRVHRMSGWLGAAKRQRRRSTFFPGIAAAMALQWGDFIGAGTGERMAA